MASIENIFQEVVDNAIEGAPHLTFAILALVLGYIIGLIGYKIVYKTLLHTNIDKKLTSKHLNLKLSKITAIAVKWVIYFIAISYAAEILDVAIIISIVNGLLAFIPGVVSAAAILIAAYILGFFIKTEIIGEKDVYTRFVGDMTFFLILYVGIATALPALGIEALLFNAILILILGSVCLGLAIALGLGLKDTVADVSKDFAKRYKKKLK